MSEDGSSCSGDDDGDVQLGFCEEIGGPVLFELEDWRDWDGGLAGGSPMLLRSAKSNCCSKSIFLAQVYAPLDGNAFHRSLYVYTCVEHGPTCRRQQIGEDERPWSRECLARLEIVVETEPEPERIATVESMGEDEALEQKDVGREHDLTTVEFLARISRAPSQALRYERGGKPLWSSRKNRLRGDPPRCRCGSRRIFEFQLLPQLLYYLKVPESNDFGSLVVYTCEASCDDFDGEEFVICQPPIDDN